MRRGEIWAGKDYSAKPRPVIIVQTTVSRRPTPSPLRLHSRSDGCAVSPAHRGAERTQKLARYMSADGVQNQNRSQGQSRRVARLDEEDMVQLNQAMMVFLGMAVSPRRGRK
jgi:mRNA interferase MazF